MDFYIHPMHLKQKVKQRLRCAQVACITLRKRTFVDKIHVLCNYSLNIISVLWPTYIKDNFSTTIL